MTYREICVLFSNVGIDSAEWDARLLLEHFCGKCSIDYFAEPDREIDLTDELLSAIKQRASRYPLQYIIGEWDFYRQTYEVSPDCLIPRSDTEILVEEAIKCLPQGARFADLCTGSGCIAISVLAERPDTAAIAVDKFERTLSVARRNAQRNGVQTRLDFLCADVLLPDFLTVEKGTLDAILCNPPYIPTDVLETLEPELSIEPRKALDGGEDGLIFYETLLKNASVYLKPNGFFLFEIGFDQAQSLSLLGERYGFHGVKILRDYGGNDRVVCLWRDNVIN